MECCIAADGIARPVARRVASAVRIVIHDDDLHLIFITSNLSLHRRHSLSLS